MESLRDLRATLAFAVIAVLAACGRTVTTVPNALPIPQLRGEAKATSPIQHVVVLVQENRSFNNFFATYPGADGTKTATVAAEAACDPPLKPEL